MSRIPEQMDVMVNTECNARCGFCVQEATYKPSTLQDKLFMKGVEKYAGQFYELGGRRIVITGGEPTLRPDRVEAVLDVLSETGSWDLTALYTNGSRLLVPREGASAAQRFKDKGLQYVNISVHDYDQARNQALFNSRRLLADPREVSAHLREIDQPFRYCATLQKGGLENADNVLDYVDFARQNEAQDVYLRELFKIDPSVSRNDSVVRYTDENFVPAWMIVDGLRERGFEPAAERAGFQGRNKRELRFTKDGFAFYVSSLDIGNERADELPYLTVMPDGQLYSTWHEKDRLEDLK